MWVKVYINGEEYNLKEGDSIENSDAEYIKINEEYI